MVPDFSNPIQQTKSHSQPQDIAKGTASSCYPQKIVPAPAMATSPGRLFFQPSSSKSAPSDSSAPKNTVSLPTPIGSVSPFSIFRSMGCLCESSLLYYGFLYFSKRIMMRQKRAKKPDLWPFPVKDAVSNESGKIVDHHIRSSSLLNAQCTQDIKA
jgi:hypothetical protein